MLLIMISPLSVITLSDFSVSAATATTTYYLRGTFNGWEATDEYALNDNGDGTFSIMVSLPAGTHKYKIGNKDWSWSVPKQDASIILDEAFMVEFIINPTDYTQSARIVVEPPAEPIIPQDAVEFNGHYYQLYNEPKNWDNAEAYCETQGGHLVTITSKEEQSFITSLLDSASKNCYWTGAIKSDKKWTWVTGEEFTYTNWAQNEPNAENGIENYIHIFGKKWTGGSGIKYVGDWNDTSKNGAD